MPSQADIVSAPRVVRPQGPKRIVRSQVPPDILNDPALKAAMSALPPNYELEIPKTVWRARQLNARCVALQVRQYRFCDVWLGCLFMGHSP